ncbi:MAG: arginine--tRNA ligase [Candidatus Woesearchaeota archaeon]
MFRKQLAQLIKQQTPLDEKTITELIEIPPDPQLGDYAFPCFRLAKQLKKSPQQIAEELAGSIQADWIQEVQANGPYINFFIQEDIYAQTILENKPIHENKEETIMVEFSQPNTHKQFHIGHLRNAALGEALSRTLTNAGYNVIRATYPGDHGAHVAKSLWYLQNYTQEIPKENKGVFLGKIYVEATKKLEEHPELKEEVSKVHQALDAEEENITKLWQETRKWSLEEFKEVYKELAVNFDVWYFESEEDKEANRIVDELLEKNIAKKSQGAIIVDLEEKGLGIAVVRKSDGTTLYLTKDLSLGQKKFQEHNLDRSIYLIDSRQKLHMQQAFAILQQMGFEKEMYHLPYEMVTLPEGAMSSRKGTVVLYEDFKKRVKKKLVEETRNKRSEWSKEQVEEVAQKLLIGSLMYGMLKVDNNTEIQFNEEEWTSLEGETGPYIQYTYARIQSILRKHTQTTNPDYAQLNTKEDKEILRVLANEKETQTEAANNYKPHIIAKYCLQLAKKTNEYYHKHNVLKEEENLREARTQLLRKIAETLERNTQLIAIPLVEEM